MMMIDGFGDDVSFGDVELVIKELKGRDLGEMNFIVV